MIMEVVKSSRGVDMLVIEGYTYHLNKRRMNAQGTLTYNWCCVAAKQGPKCKGRLQTTMEDGHHVISKGPTKHNHPLTEKDAARKRLNPANRSVDLGRLLLNPPSKLLSVSSLYCLYILRHNK